VLRMLLQGGVMAAFLAAGWARPRVTGVPLVNRDLVFNLLNGAALFLLVTPAVKWVDAHLQLGLVGMDWLSSGVGQFLVAFVLLDLARYWLHRAGHRIPFLWQFHRVHHSAEYIDATTGLRMHVVDFLQLAALPIVLFGVLLDTSGFEPWVIPAALLVGVFFDGWQHANLRIDTSRPLFKAWNLLLNNPHFHSWHHTRDGHIHDGNYSNTLIIWDRLFGSDVTQVEPPDLYGIGGDQALRNDPLSWQLLRRRDPAVDAAASG